MNFPIAHAGLIVKAPPYIGLNEGLVGYWSFNGPDMSGNTATDRSGQGNNGTLTNGPKRAIGKLGQALEFDGSNDYVDVGSGNSYDVPTLTVSAWIKRSVTGVRHMIMADNINNGNNASHFFYWEVNASNVLYLGFGDGVTDGSVSSTNTIADTNWHHVAFYRNDAAEKVQFFIDGVADGEQNYANTLGTLTTLGTNNLWIGKTNVDGFALPFNGLIDEVRIYNRALSADEIKRLYKIGSTLKVNVTRKDTLTNGLVGHWSFDGPDMSQSTNNVWALDRSGQGNNGRLANTATSTVRKAGKLGQALEFDGVDDYVLLSSSAGLVYNPSAPVESVSFWVKGSSQNNKAIYSETGNSGIGRFEIRTGPPATCCTPNRGHLMYVTIGKNNFGELLDATTVTNTTVFNNQWHHVAWVDSNGAAAFYIDGIKDSTSFNYTPDSNITLVRTSLGANGFNGTFSGFFNGLIDEVRIYNRALSADEIKRLYKIGSTFVVNKTRQDTLQEGLVGHWTFDGPDMNKLQALDRSGQGNNGTLTNGPKRAIGRIGQALEFDGSNDYVDTNDIQAINPGNSQPITLSAWIYPRSTSGAFPSILTKWNSGSGFTFFLTNNGTQVGWQVQDVGNGRATTNANTIIRDAWNHVVGVYTGTQLLVYIDGIVSATAATTATNEDSSRSFKIGIPDDGSGLDYFNGLIDEVRIYNRALSADEIKRLYNMGR